MDIQKLYDKLIKCEEIRDIPFCHIFRVLECVCGFIGSGEFFYDFEEKIVMSCHAEEKDP